MRLPKVLTDPSSGVLKPALAVEACGVLGLEVPPGRLRTALDLDELMLIWDAACSAGYLIPRSSRVRATLRLTDTSPGQTVQSWLNLMSAGLGLREGPCGGCLTVLHELSEAAGPLDLAQLAEAVRSLAPPAGEDGPCPDCGEVPEETVTIQIIPPTEIPPAVTRWVRLPSLPAGEAYQLKIALRGVSKPPVWRRISAPAALPLSLLHHVIQEAMGWEGDHPHVFSADGREYGDAYSGLGFADESTAVLAKVLPQPGATMRYSYDFGDDWEHDIVLEKVLPPDPVPRLSCLAGKGACPPEDCGGAWGYAVMKEVLADPDHEDHERLLEWLGVDDAADFDPAWFRLDEADARLGQLVT